MNYLLGLELTGSDLKITTLKRAKKKFQLYKLDNIKIPDQEDLAVSVLSDWKDKNLPGADRVDAVLALSESSIYLKEIDLPKVKSEQMSDMIYWELPSITPIPPSEVIYDWKIVKEEEAGYRVLVMVAKSQYIETLLSTFEKAQIKVVAIEPSASSFSRIAKANFGRTTLIPVVRENETDYVVAKNGIPVFSTSTAVTIKGSKEGRKRLGKKVIVDLAADAKKILDFWEEREGEKIEQVIITGDIAYKYFGLALAINRFAKIPVVIGRNKTIQNLSLRGYPEQVIARHLVSFGAAVRLLEKNVYAGINLYPKKEKEEIRKLLKEKNLSVKVSAFTFINLAVLALFLLTFLAFKFMDVSLDRKTKQAKQFAANHPANVYTSEVLEVNNVFRNVVNLAGIQKDEGVKLNKIASLTPQNLTFKAVTVDNGEKSLWKVEGVGDRTEILAFYENLKINLGAKVVTMPFSNLGKVSGNEFLISIEW